MNLWKAFWIAVVALIAGLYNSLNDGSITLIEALIIVGSVLGSAGVVWYAQNGKNARYVKAVIGALAAAITSLVTGLDDGLISSQEWTAVALAILVGAGLVYAAPGPPIEGS